MSSLKFPQVLHGLCLLALLFAAPALRAQEDDEDFFVFDEDEAPALADPLEGFNRASFAFNDKMYRIVLKPIARGLRVLPAGLRTGFNNFFNNLNAPVSSISALLQADPKNAGTELGRFLLNTTVGMGGFFDIASEVGIARDEEDLGQTLGRYGVGPGIYLVVPFFGPSSLRDALGLAGTAAINPVYDNLEPGEILAINFTAAEVALSLDRDTYEAFYDQALDPYVFFRSAWQQNRAGAVAK